MEGKPRNVVAHGWSPVASHYIEVNLQPGEEKEFVFVLGYIEKYGGTTIVENPKTAFAKAMPSSAINITKPDYILTLSQISKKLIDLSSKQGN